MVTFQLFVRPGAGRLAGATPEPLRFTQAILKAPLATKTGLTRFLPAKLDGAHDSRELNW